jgi:hypothetical protein
LYRRIPLEFYEFTSCAEYLHTLITLLPIHALKY